MSVKSDSRKLSWPIARYCSRIYMEGLNKIQECYKITNRSLPGIETDPPPRNMGQNRYRRDNPLGQSNLMWLVVFSVLCPTVTASDAEVNLDTTSGTNIM